MAKLLNLTTVFSITGLYHSSRLVCQS